MTADRLDLDALEALEAAATAVPWVLPIADLIETTSGLHVGDTMYVADAALIAALRNAAPALITAARERDAAQAALARVTDDSMNDAVERIIAQHLSRLAKRSDWAEDDTAVGGQAAHLALQVLATIRAVAGEGQEAGGK